VGPEVGPRDGEPAQRRPAGVGHGSLKKLGLHPVASWDAETVMSLFREPPLARPVGAAPVSQELVRKLLAWHHPWLLGARGRADRPEDKKAPGGRRLPLVRAHLSLRKLVYLDGHKAVLSRSKLDPLLRRNFGAMDPLEWLARLADHIPDPGKHRTRFLALLR
jgi:hypothetical protein